MKRIRILLTAMVTLGAIGGVLAFNVLAFNTKRFTKYCIRSTINGICPANAICPNGLEGNIDFGPAVPTFCYTTTAITARCDDDRPSCSATAKIIAEGF